MTPEEMLRSPRLWLLGGLMLLLCWLLLSVWTPSEEAAQSICFLRQVTEIPCPGCGMTRGIAALLKCDLTKAVQEHPLSPLFVLEVCLAWIWWGLVAAGRLRLPSSCVINRFLVLQAGLLVVVWGYRLIQVGS